MSVSCKTCGQSFEIATEDLAFYDKVSPVIGSKKQSIPPPTLCPTCRLQRRLTHINERILYRRPSSKTGKDIIASLSPDKPYKVYEPKEWWGDDWDAMDSGREVSFDRPVFDQLSQLTKDVPLLALYVDGNENSDYVNYSGWDKNCYLCFCVDYSQDCLHCHSVYYSKNTVDCYSCLNMELCYECVSCRECYHCFFCTDSIGCSDSAFLYDCLQCRNCFGCVGLRQKEYCFFNEQLTKEAYLQAIAAYPLSSAATIAAAQQKVGELVKNHPRRFYTGQNNENSVGNYISNCKNAYACYDCSDIEDCKYCNSMRGAKDCYDISHWGHPAELCYECMGVGEGFTSSAFCSCCWPNCLNLLYCFSCSACKDCFGCVGLKHKQYCIFNRQYSKEEYDQLVPKIIEQMRKHGEWGEFFAISSSPFCYNEAAAQDYFPLTKEQALAKGYAWKDKTYEMPAVSKVIPARQLPDAIAGIPDDVLNWAIECEVTGKPFKIVKQELEFYRMHNLPLPRLHPDERHRLRMAKRNPRILFHRKCDNCKKDMETTYAPERPEKVFCEECYLKAVY